MFIIVDGIDRQYDLTENSAEEYDGAHITVMTYLELNDLHTACLLTFIPTEVGMGH